MKLSRRSLLAAAVPELLRAAPSDIRTISVQPEHYIGWPTLTRLRSGELLVVYSGGRQAHVCPFGRVELMRSRDDGETWSWPEVLMDSAIDDRDAGICETSRGTLLVTTFTSLAYEAVKNRPPLWDSVDRRLDPQRRKALLGMWMLRSTDGGLTWSAPYRVPVNSPHGPTSLSDGRLLYAGKQLWEGTGKIGVAESRDDGASWRWLADIPTRPGDTHENYHELHAVETSPGKLISHIRNHNNANKGETLQSESSDGGRSWSAPRTIGVWGLPSHLARLRNGDIVMSYGYRRAPFGNQARISKDGGLTWSTPITISSDGAGVDLGYPSTVELASGDPLTLWYERLASSPQGVLRTRRWQRVPA